MRSRTRCCEAGRLTQSSLHHDECGCGTIAYPRLLATNGVGCSLPARLRARLSRARFRQELFSRARLRAELLNQSRTAAVTSLAARGLTETRTRAAASRAGWPLPDSSAASDDRLSGSPTRRAPLVIGASTYGATTGHTAWASRRKMLAPAPPR